MTTMTTGMPRPFASDSEYLDGELSWLQLRASRIMAQKRLRELATEQLVGPRARQAMRPQLDPKKLAARIEELSSKEKELRRLVDERLEIHRQDPESQQLSLDTLCEDYDLSLQERTLLIVCLPQALSSSLSEEIFQDLARPWGTMTTSDVMAILAPKSTADWMQVRSSFYPSGNLRRAGLLWLEASKEKPLPTTLVGREVSITLEALRRMSSNNDVMEEGADDC
jgi:Winged helix domain, variant